MKWSFVFFATISLLPLHAQDTDEGPGRGVARISLINGDVSVRRGDSGDYVAAALNAPLVVEDRVVTGPGSRAEVQFDWANRLRLSARAEARMAELEFERYIVQIANGTVTWSVLRDQDAYVEVSTPSVSVRPVKRGVYRVTVNEDGSSEITVRSGEAEIFTPQGSERLRGGKTMLARGTQASPEFRTAPEISKDDWDRWNEGRDRSLLNTQSYNYMSRDIYGGEDLDAHGRWIQVPSYGWVWSPRVDPGWAPYRHGRWSWVDWYGWSWVSADPWGWAPYHYGRWFNQGPYGWVWYPGVRTVRHYWAPAYVAFFGLGGVGVGWGRVGWVPLAPFERCYPWWGSRYYYGGRNRGFFNNGFTVVNNVNITNVYRNARVHNGYTVIDNDGFRRGRTGNSVRLTDADFRTASVARGPVPLAPERESQRLADRETSVRGVEGRSSERFFSNRRPTQVERVSFDEQRRGVEQVSRRTFGEVPSVAASGETPRRAGDAATSRSEARGADPDRSESSQRGWRRAGEAPTGATSASGAVSESVTRGERSTGAASSEDGWRRFGSARVGEASTGRGERSSGDTAGAGSSNDSVSRGERSSGASSSEDGWRRFGSARVSEGSGADRGERSASGRVGEAVSPQTDSNPGAASRSDDRGGRGGSSDGWRRFESQPEPSSGGRSERGSDSGWRRGSPASPSAEPPSAPSQSAPSRSERFSAPRDGGGRSWESQRSAPSGDSIRISPPMVRERSSGGGGAESRSAPSGDPGAGRRGGGDGGAGAARGGDGGGRSGSSRGGRSR